MKKIIVASHNEGKVQEFRTMFEKLGISVVSLRDLDFNEEIEETGTTFQENSRIKAEAISDRIKEPVIADDSGLVIDALNGKPGIYSARYAGEAKDDNANIEKVLKDMESIPFEKRTARFVCVLSIAQPGKETSSVAGKCEGFILDEKRGANGFGYDPIFFIPSKGKTLAELKSDEKNEISHRANALEELQSRWADIFNT